LDKNLPQPTVLPPLAVVLSPVESPAIKILAGFETFDVGCEGLFVLVVVLI